MERALSIAALGLLFGGCAAPVEGHDPQPRQKRVGQSIQAPGCSASGEPIHGAVENALGIIFGILLVVRLRSARRRREADQRDSEIPNGRMPYRDLGMRDSLGSMPRMRDSLSSTSDDR